MDENCNLAYQPRHLNSEKERKKRETFQGGDKYEQINCKQIRSCERVGSIPTVKPLITNVKQRAEPEARHHVIMCVITWLFFH